MRKALVFGGLSFWGLAMTEALLSQEIDVYPISSALSETERNAEKERELLVGRHAFFHRKEEGSLNGPIDFLYLMDTFRADQKENNQLKQKLQERLAELSQTKCHFLFFLSSLDVYGAARERATVRQIASPITPEGIAANQMEKVFVQAMIKIKPSKAVIFRTDRTVLGSSQRGSGFAQRMTKLAVSDFSGLKITQYFTDHPDNSTLNQEFIRLAAL